MSKVWMLIFIIFSSHCLATEFNHIKISPNLERIIQDNTSARKNLKTRTQKSIIDGKNDFLNMILGGLLSGSTSTEQSPFPSEDESPLYARIREYLNQYHQEIGQTEVNQINHINHQFNLGVENFTGFSWQKPMGAITIYADRQVTPNLFGDNWLIQDMFTLEINAATFLEKLSEAGYVEMNIREIGAFAGITFKRVYTSYHYADSYQKGLTADFTKLFLPFTKFNLKEIESLNKDEIIKKEDFWTAQAGGMISTPPLYGFSGGAAFLAELAYNQSTILQASGKSRDTNAERLRFILESELSSKAQSSLSLQLDFFKLIKLTLLNFDLNYEYSKEVNQTLSFNQTIWSSINENEKTKKELNSLVRGYSKIDLLSPYVQSLDNSTSQSMEMKGSLLIFGRLEKSQTEQIKVINNGEIRTFYKHYSQSVKVIQNFLSRIFSAVIYKIFKFTSGVTNAVLFKKKFNLEYEATTPQSIDPELNRVASLRDFSFNIELHFEAGKTDKWYTKYIKKSANNFISEYTTLPSEIQNLLNKNDIKGPLSIDSILRIDSVGFQYFIGQGDDNIWKNIAEVCQSNRVNDWSDLEKRKVLAAKIQIGNESCVKKMGHFYQTFIDDFHSNSMQPSLKKFRSFILYYFKESKNLSDVFDLFSKELTFLSGRIEAKTSQGNSFVQVFSSGQFRGLGVIDNFKRSKGSRAPATILGE